MFDIAQIIDCRKSGWMEAYMVVNELTIMREIWNFML